MSIRTIRLRGCVLTLLLACLTLTAPAVAHAQTGRTWSQGAPSDRYNASAGLGGDLRSIACPAATQCTGVDSAGNEVTFNPTRNGSPAVTNILRAAQGDLAGLACPSLTQCTAVAGAGDDEVTFNPSNPGQATVIAFPNTRFYAISCPSTSECLAITGSSGVEFNPGDVGAITTIPIEPSGGGFLNGISCVSTTECTTIDDDGDVSTFNPLNPGTPQLTNVVPGTAFASDDISCTSAGACIALSSGGHMAEFVGTAPSSTTTGSINTTGVTGLACPQTTTCVAVNYGGQATEFDPASLGSPQPVTVDAGQLNSIACVTTSSCVAVDAAGRAVSFSPSSLASAQAVEVDDDPDTTAIACPAVDQCTEIDAGGVQVTFDPSATPVTALTQTAVDTYPVAISCPSPTQCTVLNIQGNETTFDPLDPAGASTVKIDGFLIQEGLACPSTTQCTISGYEGFLTFNPQNPGSPTADTSVSTEQAIACPTTTQCTVMTTSGGEATFDPQDASASPTTVAIDPNGSTDSISCPSPTQCTTVDQLGGEATFNPESPGSPPMRTIDTVSVEAAESGTVLLASQPGWLTDVSCPSSTDCVATDLAGNVLEGDPTGTAAWIQQALIQTAGLSGVACPDPGFCVATDDSGDTSVGRQPPINSGAPTISGSTVVGVTLTESHGVWNPAPTSYRYQWSDCDSAGQNCVAISGATEPSYTLTSSDTGHTIEVQETALNPGGSGGPVTSAQVGPVTSPPPPPPPVTSTQTSPQTTITPTATKPVAQAPSTALVLADLRRALEGLRGTNARLRVIVQRHGFIDTVRVPSAGVLKLTWTVTAHHRTTVLASVTVRFTRARSEKVTIRLTRAGLKVFAHATAETITEHATFTPTGAHAVTASEVVKLKRG